MPIREAAYREHIESAIVGVVWGGVVVAVLVICAVVFHPLPVWAWVLGGCAGVLFGWLFFDGVRELATRNPKLIIDDRGIEDRRQPGGSVVLEWDQITKIEGKLPDDAERVYSVPIAVAVTDEDGDEDTVVIDIGSLEAKAKKVYKAIVRAWVAAQRDGRATAPPRSEAAEAERVYLETAAIPTMVVRYCRGDPITALGGGIVVAGVALGVLSALDANAVRYFCAGFVLFASVLFAFQQYGLNRDRRVKLVIGPNGFKDLRDQPPTVVSLARVRDLEVGLYKPRRTLLLLLINIQRTDGSTEELAFQMEWFDPDPAQIVEHIRQVWKMVRARELKQREEEPKGQSKPPRRPKPFKRKADEE